MTTAIDWPPEPSFESFLGLVNAYVASLLDIATLASESEPGTAELLETFAQNHACMALDLVQRWPS